MNHKSKLYPLVEGDFMISFNDAAIQYLIKYLHKHPPILDKNSSVASEHLAGVRFSIRQAGCSGWMYETAIVNGPKAEDDLCFEVQNIGVYIDSKAMKALNGVVVDFVKQQFGQAKFVYNNPNEKSQCGCGEGFMLEQDVPENKNDK